MAKNPIKALRWLRLDNAAKIYPAARRKNWSNVFRQSATLTDEVDKAVLESALEITVKRFPSIAARLRKGLFWYYLQQIDSPPPDCTRIQLSSDIYEQERDAQMRFQSDCLSKSHSG